VHILECNCASGLDLEKENFVAIIIARTRAFAFRSLQFAIRSSQFARSLATLSLSLCVPFCVALIICSPSSQIKNMPKQIKCIQCVYIYIYIYIYKVVYMVALVYESLGMHFVSVGNCALVRIEQGALS